MLKEEVLKMHSKIKKKTAEEDKLLQKCCKEGQNNQGF